MMRRFLVEVIDIGHPGPEPRTGSRWTCLQCGVQTQPQSISDELASARHVCGDPWPGGRGVFALQNQHWREIVRDALINGRDAEAIEIICHEMGLVPP